MRDLDTKPTISFEFLFVGLTVSPQSCALEIDFWEGFITIHGIVRVIFGREP